MDQERHRFVQQYVERQKAYLPTYTVVDPLIERHGTPLKPPPGNDEYGFDTPVLRPRAPMKSPEAAQQASPSQSRLRTHEADLPRQARPPTPHKAARLGNRGAGLGKPGAKRKKDPTPALADTDDERAARLADRRERKRKKRAIVNAPQTRGDDVEPIAAPKKGRPNGRKAKKPAALALLYGFSATNVTKDRLTVKPAPSLGVFNKGKASAKKNVASSSRNELFSESVFLNKPEERAADPSKVDDSSVSSIRQEPSKKNRTECTGAAATKAPQASTGTAVESEDWDIELQSKLPSSACDISSEVRVENYAPVILDLRRAEWSASLDAGEKHAGRVDKTRTPSTAITRCRPKEYSTVATSNLRDDLGLALAADVSSIEPSHSASQVGARAADTGPSDLPMATSEYFAEPTSDPVQELSAKPPEASASTDGIEVPDSRIPEQDVRLDVQTTRRAASPISSLISVPQPMIQYQTRYDIVPLEIASDSSPYEGFCADVDADWECGHAEPDVSVERSRQGDAAWDWCPSWSPSGDLDLAVEAQAEFDREERYYEAEARQDLTVYEDEAIDGAEQDVPGFLEGRALLLGIPGDEGCMGMTGLAQAEMDVASRLRDHWRPLRF